MKNATNKKPYIFIIVLSSADGKACLMVSEGLSQGFEIISNIDASEKQMLNIVFLVAGQNYCSGFCLQTKEPLFQVVKVRTLVLKIQENILADDYGLYVYMCI